MNMVIFHLEIGWKHRFSAKQKHLNQQTHTHEFGSGTELVHLWSFSCHLFRCGQHSEPVRMDDDYAKRIYHWPHYTRTRKAQKWVTMLQITNNYITISLSRCVTCFLSYTHRSIASSSSSLVSSAENDKQIYTSFSLLLSLSFARSLLSDADTHTHKHTRGQNMFLAERETKQPDRKHSSSHTVTERHTKHTEHSVNNSN